MDLVTEPIEIEVGPEFDAREARRIADALTQIRPDTAVELDFTRVKAFDDRSIGLLATGLAGHGGNVSVLGLDRYHVRLLRYLGVLIQPDAPEDDGG